MKKALITLLLFVGLIVFAGCSLNDSKDFKDQAKTEQETGLPSQAEQEAILQAEAEAKAQAEAEAQAKAELEKKLAEEAAAKAETEKESQKEQKVEKDETTTKKPSTSTDDTSANTTAKKEENTSTETAQVVQRANTDTGISWDGKSSIVYTYTDGTTGTTPKDGATYEVLPGLTNTYVAPKEDVEQASEGICSECGRKEGDGSNGTCLQFWAHDDVCPHCGIAVPVNTCHTCG